MRDLRSSRSKKYRAFSGAVVLLTAAFTGKLPGQVHGEHVEVEVLNIEISVLDDAGRPVAGLEKDQFRVSLAGQPWGIDYFVEIRDGTRKGDDRPSEMASGGPIRLLVFVDETTLRESARNDALAELDRQLSSLPQDPEVALFAFDGDQLHPLQPWTTSRQEVRLALAKAASRESPFLRLDLQRRTRRESTGCRGKQEIAIDEARKLSEAAVSAFDMAGARPARGAMVVVAGSWPAVVPGCRDREGRPELPPSEGVAPRIRNPESVDARARLRSAYRLLSDEIARRRWLLFPLDGRGFLPRLLSIDVETTVTPGVGTGTARRVEGGDQEELHALLDRLARDTGGQALLNAQVGRLAEILTASVLNYYSLGVTWGPGPRSREASIEVDVLVEGARAFHRKTLPAPLSTDEAVRRDLVATLLSPEDVPRELDLELGRVETEGSRMRLPLSLRIPLSGFPGPASATPFRAQLGLYLLAMDEGGGTSPLIDVEEPIVVSGPSPPRDGDYFLYRTEVRLRRTTSRLAVAVRDLMSGVVLRGVASLGAESQTDSQ